MPPDRVCVRVEPGHRFGRPHVNGVPTETVAGNVFAGDDVDTVAEEYGLSRREVLVALWFEAEHGEYREQWRDWAQRVYGVLAHGLEVDGLEPPEVRRG